MPTGASQERAEILENEAFWTENETSPNRSPVVLGPSWGCARVRNRSLGWPTASCWPTPSDLRGATEQPGNGLGKFVSKNHSFCKISIVFRFSLLLGHLHCWVCTGNRTPRRWLNVHQEAVGHRSGRFQARTHPLVGPGRPGNGLGKFHFLSIIHHFSRIRLAPGMAHLGQLTQAGRGARP